MNRLSATSFLAAVALYGTVAVTTANAQFNESERLEYFVSELQLSDVQEAQARPILVSGQQERLAILQSAGIEPGTKPKLHQMIKLRQPMQASQARTEAQLAAVLSPEQMTRYRVLIEEMREEMRAQFQ